MPDALDHLHHTRQIYDASPLGRSLLRAASDAVALAILGGTVVGIGLFQAPSEAAARDVLHLGTAAIWDVPATGDASTSQVVIGTDSRLTNARTPTAHSHAPSDITGTAVITTDPRLSDARAPTAHTHATSDILGLGYYATGTDASYLTGTLADARLSSNVALRNADNAFSVAQTIAGSAPSSVSAGQVAIGGGLAYFGPNIRVTSSGGNGYVQAYNGSAYNKLFLTGAGITIDSDTGNTLFIGTAPSSVSSGQVAIGGGLIRLENANDASIYLTETSGATLRIRAGGSSGNIVASTGKNLDLWSNAALHARLESGGAAIFYGTAPSSVSAGEARIGGGQVWAHNYVYAAGSVYAGYGGLYSWKLGGYTSTAPSATGYVTITINGTTYKLLAST